MALVYFPGLADTARVIAVMWPSALPRDSQGTNVWRHRRRRGDAGASVMIEGGEGGKADFTPRARPFAGTCGHLCLLQ